MNQLTYNLSLLAGVACIASGAAIVFGAGVALMVTGITVLALTFISMKVGA